MPSPSACRSSGTRTWRCRSCAPRASRPPGRRAAAARRSTSRAARGSSPPAASASPATATRARPGCCSTPAPGSPTGGVSSTTSPGPRPPSAPHARLTHWPSAWSTVSEDARPAAARRAPAGRRDRPARRLRRWRRTDPGEQRLELDQRAEPDLLGLPRRALRERAARCGEGPERGARPARHRRRAPAPAPAVGHPEPGGEGPRHLQSGADPDAADPARHDHERHDVHADDGYGHRPHGHDRDRHGDTHDADRHHGHELDRHDDGHRHGRGRHDGRRGDDPMMAGQVLAGRYELGERLGVGARSTVVRAFGDRLERDVAIKLLAEHLADDDQFVARFRREALSVARLVHPNIVEVFDFGLDEPTHRQYIVMELVRGRSGAEILRDEGVLELRDALSIVAQACRGLEYAHRNGVVHRDVKPGNLLRGEDGVVKLADFGIAKAFSDESSITQVGSVLGTAAYLAPEQAAGEQAGPAADLYALGVVAYQLMSGRLPYEAQSLTELALKQQREVPPPLHHVDPSIPPALSVAVERALALDPRRRHASADAMRAAVIDGARGIGPDGDATHIVGGGRFDDDATSATTVLAGEPGTGPM